MKRIMTVGFVSVALVLTTLMIGFNTVSAEELAKKQVLTYGINFGDLGTLDPHLTNVGYLHILQGMFNSLVRYPVGDMGNVEGIEPDLALKWDASSDNKVWTFYLRQGVQFHKGYGEFTSEDVKFSFERQKDMPWGGEYKHIEQIETPDKYTVKFTLKHSDPFFLQKLVNYHGGQIVSKKAVEDLGKKFVTYPVGTGPFQADSFSSGDKYVLVRNEKFWKGKPILEKIIYRFMRPVASRTIAIESGELDMTQGPFQIDWAQRVEKAGVIVDGMRIGQHEYLCFNMTKPPLEKKAVRKALAYAICKEGLDELWGVNHESYHSFVPPYVVGYLPDDQIPEKYITSCDPQKAKKLLAEAGYPDGFDMGTIVASPRADEVPAVEVFQDQLKEIGVKFNISVVDHSGMHKRIRDDVNAMVWYNASRPSATVYLRQWYHSDSIVLKKTAVTNFSHYGEVDADGDGDIKDNNVDALIEAAERATSPDEYVAIIKQIQMQLFEDLPCLPMGRDRQPLARQKWTRLGYEPKSTMVYGYAMTEKTAILKH
jgi:peptide/nickel transport system substrate-binding protein